MNEQQLVQRILTGSDTAWDEFVDYVQATVYSVFVGQFRFQAADADDLFQDVMVKCFRNDFQTLRDWSGESSLRAYLRTIAWHAAIDFKRRFQPESSEIENDSADASASPEEEAAQRERFRIIDDEARAPLDHVSYRLLVWLEGWSYNQMAATLQLSTSNVGVRLKRSIKKVADAFQERMDLPHARLSDAQGEA